MRGFRAAYAASAAAASPLASRRAVAGRGPASAGPDADMRVGADIAEPLGPGAEPGGHQVGARLGMADNFEDHVAAGTGFSPSVLEHQQPRPEHENPGVPGTPR